MSQIRINSIKIKNYRSFGDEQIFEFPNKEYNKPVAIVGYNNSGKTNLMNCILYALQVNFVSKDTFSIDDFYNRNIKKIPEILLKATSSEETKFDGDKKASLLGYHKLIIYTDGDEIIGSKIQSLNSLTRKTMNYGGSKDDENYQAFGASRYFNIFYINFHNIKDEIITQKTSWGNLKSFLAKHIKKLVDEDEIMKSRKKDFFQEVKNATEKVIQGKMLNDDSETEKSKLFEFILRIKKNYSQNLRDNNIVIDFSLPDYEDIFLQMLFKIGLNGSKTNLVPINHFGDGYISMFVMAVIQAIGEERNEDKCLFLFEEPESFLHENHQEYFYKMVLCSIASKGHQVIYTTHSDKMVNIFDTKGLIRLEIENEQTVKKYNNIGIFSPSLESYPNNEIVTLGKYNEFISTIEPNLNKILFSHKVILVEGPNDVLIYKYIIQKEIEKIIAKRTDIDDKKKFAETFLNFKNISIVPHHGKSTAGYLIELCKHFGVDYFTINDLDFDNLELINKEKLSSFSTLDDLKKDDLYKKSDKKAMITTNYNLVRTATKDKIHFNVPKIEKVIGYDLNDKNSLKIYELISSDDFNYTLDLFPKILTEFLGLDNLNVDKDNLEEENDLVQEGEHDSVEINSKIDAEYIDLPF